MTRGWERRPLHANWCKWKFLARGETRKSPWLSPQGPGFSGSGSPSVISRFWRARLRSNQHPLAFGNRRSAWAMSPVAPCTTRSFRSSRRPVDQVRQPYQQMFQIDLFTQWLPEETSLCHRRFGTHPHLVEKCRILALMCQVPANLATPFRPQSSAARGSPNCSGSTK